MSDTIPCKDCLVLATCRHRLNVKCKVLSDWLTSNRQSIRTTKNLRDIKKCFPNITHFGRSPVYKKDLVFFYK
jgi:hypothetical protein